MSIEVRDCNGALLADGDNVTLIKDLKLKGSSTVLKRGTMIRPTLFTNGSPAIYGNINWDFDTSDTTAALTFSPTTYGTWDSGVWDSAVWGSDTAVQNNWQGATGTGKAAGIRLKVSASGIQVQWVSTDVVFEEGGIL